MTQSLTRADAHGLESVAATPRPDRHRVRDWFRAVDKPRLTLALVAVVHGLLPVVLLGVHHFYGHDEVVYLSQYSSHSPAAGFSAPRSRGTPLLVAPVTALTTSLVALRVYLAVLSMIGTYLAFVPWFKALAVQRRAMSPYVVPTAALLVSTLWVSIYYSFEAMPNQWAMFGIVAAVGLVLSANRRPSKRTVLGIILALGLTGLFRPQDSLWPGLALLVCIAFFRDRTRSDRLRLAGIVGLGLIAGWVDWIVEAYVYYQGPVHRIHASLAINGGTGLHFSLAEQWSVLSGPLLCRNGCQAHATPAAQVWWVVGGVLLVAAMAVAWRRRTSRIVAVSIACGMAVIAEYTITVTYGAPRFLLPAYGLLSIPIAVVVVWLVQARPRPLTPLLIVVLAAQVVTQTHVLSTINGPIQRHADARVALDAALARLGVGHPGCVTYWNKGGTVSDYVLGCRNFQIQNRARPTAPALAGPGAVYVFGQHRAPRTAWFKSWPYDTVASSGKVIHVWSNGSLAPQPGSVDTVAAGRPGQSAMRFLARPPRMTLTNGRRDGAAAGCRRRARCRGR